MKKILKAAYNFLNSTSETGMRHIVFNGTDMIVISNGIILYYNLEKLNIPNIEYITNKYLSFGDLEAILKQKFNYIIPEREGFLLDFQKTVPYSGFFTESIHKSDYFNKEVAEYGIFGYNTEEKVIRIPVGFALHLLKKAKENKPIKSENWNINLKTFNTVTKAVTVNTHKKSVKLEFFEIPTGKKIKQKYVLLSENTDEPSRTDTFAIVSEMV